MMTTPILHSKLMPPRIHARAIQREGLLARLDDEVGKKLTLVSAPTGFGKTTLVGLWLAERKLPTAWVSLDENDNDPVRFWTYIITALRRLDASIGRTALAALASTQLPSHQTLLTLIINELSALSSSGVLVLEDYHVITTAEIHAAVTFLLQHKPDALHLVIISRSEPDDLPLGILRARDELLEITTNDLRFTRSETESFLREALQGEISPSDTEKLQERTEGWVAGLRLAALSIQNKSGEIQSFSGSHRYVADYLIREVFAYQQESIQSFLLKTCFFSRLTGALCDAITENNDGASTLEQLERENLFLVQLEHLRGRSWYRYHQLFAESIQSLARQQLGEVGVQSVFEKASIWYASQQLFDDAIETALAAGLFERALELVETFGEIYNLNEMRTLTRWMEHIPLALTLRHPVVCMAYAQVILFTSDRFAAATATRIEPYLRAAEEVWQGQRNEAKVGTVWALRGMILLWQGEFRQALDAIYQALEKMPESEVFWRGISLLNAAGAELFAGHIVSAQDKILEARALLGASQNIFGMLAATGMLSEIFYAQGHLEICAQLNRQILTEAVGEVSMLDDQGEAHLRLARVAYEQNDLESAALQAAKALELGQTRANELLQAQAAGCLALVRTAKGQRSQAQIELKTLSAQVQSPPALTEIRTVQALLAVRAGEAPSAWLESNHESLPAQTEREAFILARQHIAEGDTAKALALLQPALANSAGHGRVRSQVEALCLAALAGGNIPAAAEPLLQALTIGHEAGFRRLFLDEGARMFSLLQEILPILKKPALRQYAAALLHLFSPEVVAKTNTAPDSLALVEPLSQQEIRVLKLLAAGLSNGEIASELVVSTNTVKTHVKNIYRKLNINSRESARMMAKELRLL